MEIKSETHNWITIPTELIELKNKKIIKDISDRSYEYPLFELEKNGKTFEIWIRPKNKKDWVLNETHRFEIGEFDLNDHKYNLILLTDNLTDVISFINNKRIKK